jgi:hypothetical protein
MRFTLLVVAQIFCPTLVLAQNPPAPQQPNTPSLPVAAASSFATTEVRLGGRYIGGRWVPGPAMLEGPARITITYGQPHARGRQIIGNVVPFDSVWRLGANLATILHTDVDMTLGGTFLTKGEYSLYALPTKSDWQLIINRQIGQWGTDYDVSQDVARIPLRGRTLTDPVESLTIYLIPALDPKGTPRTMPHGTLAIVWGKTEFRTDWRIGR